MSTRQTRTFVSILILVLAVLIVIGSCATRRKAISEEDFFEVWSGTWINTEYKGGGRYPKIVIHPDGTMQNYITASGTVPSHKHEITILDH
jgi:hypothetical protein